LLTNFSFAIKKIHLGSELTLLIESEAIQCTFKDKLLQANPVIKERKALKWKKEEKNYKKLFKQSVRKQKFVKFHKSERQELLIGQFK